MTDILVQTDEYVTLVGAGPVSKGQLGLATDHAPCVIAADGGAQMLRNYGMAPEKVIGDLDSIDKRILEKIPASAVHRVHEQDSTDFEKCLARIRAPLILGLGFLGRRLDHQLAALNALVRNPGGPCILIGSHDIVFHAGTEIALTLRRGSRVSIFPMAPVRGWSQGLAWPLDGLDLAPGGRIGTSNRVVEGPLRLGFERPGALVMLPRAALGAAVRALGGRA